MRIKSEIEINESSLIYGHKNNITITKLNNNLNINVSDFRRTDLKPVAVKL